MKRSLQWAHAFFLLTVGILVVFGIGSLLRIYENQDRAFLYSLYGLAMFADAALMLFCAWQLTKKTKTAFSLAAVVLTMNIILTIFDQVGWVDILFVLLNLVTLVFLILARKEFFSA